MQYIIIANPCAGRLAVDRHRASLTDAAAILNASIHGLDTDTRDEFRHCARELAEQCDVLVAAGGDGTVSDVINAIDTSLHPIAYLPLGTGNALAYALKTPESLTAAARRIKAGAIRAFDLIDCDHRARAFMASVGIEASILHRISRIAGRKGRYAYFRAVAHAYFKDYQPPDARVRADNKPLHIKKLLSLMVLKQPYYGFGMKVMPEARFDDRCLHLRSIQAGLLSALGVGTGSLTTGNRIGRHLCAATAAIHLDRSLQLQMDGNLGWKADRFNFTILPRALKIKF